MITHITLLNSDRPLLGEAIAFIWCNKKERQQFQMFSNNKSNWLEVRLREIFVNNIVEY